MGFIQINTVTLAPAPTIPKLVTVMHRLTSNPDIIGNYIVDTTSLVVPVGGVLNSPFIISSLLDSTSYTVKIFDDCGSFYKSYVTTIVTSLVSCPAIISIIGGSVDNTQLNVYVGAKETIVNPNGAEILAGIHSFQNVNLDVLADWTSFLSTPKCLWFAIEAASVAANKNAYIDNSNPDNFGLIATISDLFPAAQVVTVNGVPYYTSTTNYRTQVANFTSTFKLQKL